MNDGVQILRLIAQRMADLVAWIGVEDALRPKGRRRGIALPQMKPGQCNLVIQFGLNNAIRP